MQGVTPDIQEKAEAVSANVLTEDGVLLRTCEHGLRHPVGDIYHGYVSTVQKETRHERVNDRGPHPGVLRGQPCECGCCLTW